jgi:Uma2 family endonuclease
MPQPIRWSTADLDALPDNGTRYEIVAGELYMSKQPDWHHQFACGRIFRFLDDWNEETGAGLALVTPGIIFADDDNVAPDVVWVSRERFSAALGDDGKLHAAPELVVEVLSPGQANAERDMEVKRKLYSRRGVHEYWVVDWKLRQVELYRREEAVLTLQATLFAEDMITTPLLPGFRCQVRRLFADIEL